MPLPSIAIAADHAGFEMKQLLVAYLAERSYPLTDFGPPDASRVDYPDYAALVAEAVSQGQADLGILVCGTGIGMAIAANKFAGVRAANLLSPEFALLARQHNAANVAALSGRFVDAETNLEIVEAFLNAEPLGGRHADRVDKIRALEAGGD